MKPGSEYVNYALNSIESCGSASFALLHDIPTQEYTGGACFSLSLHLVLSEGLVWNNCNIDHTVLLQLVIETLIS